MWAKICKGASYIVGDISQIPENRNEWVDILPQIERERYCGYSNRNAADLFLLGRILLRKELLAIHSLPFDVEIKIDNNGKPFLNGNSQHGSQYDSRQDLQHCSRRALPNFSISHSKEKVAVAIADVPVGIDIQKCVDRDKETLLAMGEKVFSQQEMAMLRNAATERLQECFTQMWAIKESYVKMLGTGLANATDIDISAIINSAHSTVNVSESIACYYTCLDGDYYLSIITKNL